MCAPPGRDAAAFFHAAAAAAGQTQAPLLLMTLPDAGHLQLLQDRAALPFAEMCGVGARVPERQVVDLCGNLIVACARAWLSGGGGAGVMKGDVVVAGSEGEGEYGGLRSIDPAVGATVVWEEGGGVVRSSE